MKKFLCLSLAALMLLFALVACAGNGDKGNADDSGTDTVVETNEWGEEAQEHNVPDELDYQGMEIGIACRPEIRYRREFSLDAEDMADPVDAKVQARNNWVQKELGVTLTLIPVTEFWDTAGIISYVTTESKAAGQSKVDVVAPYAAWAVTSQLRGYYVNLLDKNTLPYLDTTKYYWNQGYVDAATCNNRLYYIVGDLNLTIYDKSLVVFTNMSLAAENGINPDDLYKTVHDKAWTYEYFYNVVDGFTYQDVGDTQGSIDPKDIVPLSGCKNSEAYDGFVRGWDLNYIVENEDGTHSLNVDGNTKLEDAVTYLKNLYSIQGVYLDSIENTFDRSFIGGNSLFCVDILYRNAQSNLNLRNVKFTYAVLPLPMYNTDQGKYLTTSQDAYNTMSVMAHHPDKLEAVSAALELLGYKSYNEVRPFYIERMVKAQYVTGAEQIKMLEYAMNGLSFDTATVYAEQVGSVSYELFRSTLRSGQTVSDRWAEKRDGIEMKMLTFDEWFNL